MLLNGNLIPKLLNNFFASCFFIVLDFLLLHTAHFDTNIVLPFLVFETFKFMFSVFYLHYRQNESMFYNDLTIC